MLCYPNRTYRLLPTDRPTFSCQRDWFVLCLFRPPVGGAPSFRFCGSCSARAFAGIDRPGQARRAGGRGAVRKRQTVEGTPANGAAKD
jgi:hypothetical protein